MAWKNETAWETNPRLVTVKKHLFCDWCNTEITEQTFEVREGRVMLKLGYNYPDGGSAEVLKADLCEDCFKNKLVPFLESNGCKVRTENQDW